MKHLIPVLSIAVTTSAFAAIAFDAEKNVITVADFPKEAPCSLAQLHRADQMQRWGRAEYDEANDTYTVNATLVVGENDRGSTYFQIGTRTHPRETLIMKGGLYVMPPFVARVNSELKWARALERQGKEVTWNGLIMGDPKDQSVTPSLKIATAPPFTTHRFCAGILYPGKKTGYRAKLDVYNGTIEPLESNSPHRIDSELHCELRVRNSHLRGFRKSFFYGHRGDWSQFEDSVFENCYMGPINSSYRTEVKNCVFRNCGLGFGDWGGPMNLLLTDCTFETNQRNWRVHRGRARLVDCTIGKSAQENLVYDRFRLGDTPEVIVSHHLVAEVVDQNGEPVPGALVMVIPEQLDTDLMPCKAQTGKEGKTPGRDARDALLAREYAARGVAGRQEPERVEYSYEIIVEAKGFKEKCVTGVRVQENWQRMPITLER